MTLLDSIHGVIDRRILLNYRIDPAAASPMLPKPFRPKLYKGYAIGGVCMIRFKGLRPKFVPSWMGLNSENAAYRIAVEWEQNGQRKEGVFVPRRDTNSLLQKTLGGSVFPGVFRKSSFDSAETSDHIAVQISGEDSSEQIDFAGVVTDELPEASLFPTLEDASNFFLLGSTGYSATNEAGHFHGVELDSLNWKVVPLRIEQARANFFDNSALFPPGSLELDCALLMRGIEHEWHSQPDLYVAPNQSSLVAAPA